MTTVEQLETAIRDFIEECKKQSDSEWPCLQCPYEHFCDRLRFPFDILPSEWEVDDANTRTV